MSDFLRPEAVETLRRYSGVLTGAAVAGVGLWWGLTSGGVVWALGWIMVALGAVLVWSAVQRLRFVVSAEDPGVVEVLEGRISYFGPSGGGFAGLSEISEIRMATRGTASAWVLVTPGQPDLVIPIGAQGAEALFDAFGSLPGLTGAMLIEAVNARPVAGGTALPVVVELRPQLRRIWKRPPMAIR